MTEVDGLPLLIRRVVELRQQAADAGAQPDAYRLDQLGDHLGAAELLALEPYIGR